EDDQIDRVMAQQARQQVCLAATAFFDGVVPDRRPCVEPFDDDLVTGAELLLHDDGPAGVGREALDSKWGATPGVGVSEAEHGLGGHADHASRVAPTAAKDDTVAMRRTAAVAFAALSLAVAAQAQGI